MNDNRHCERSDVIQKDAAWIASSAMPPRNDAHWIPWAIIAFFVCFITLLSGFAWIAFRTYPGEITQDSYKKGLAYNAAIASADAQQAAGWKSTLATASHGLNVDIAFTLRDAAGHPLDNARVIAHLIRPTQAGHDVEIPLQGDRGLYRGSAALPWPGVWELRLSATRGGDHYQQSKTLILQ
ncbi:MAG: FixH family protein [Pseudomonadota bacterium]|nr:FixH family protein [Pseudomonadota bacterium]